MCWWKQWKKVKTRYADLTRLGIPEWKAWQYANTRKGYWHTANSPIVTRVLTNAYFEQSGLMGLSLIYCDFCLTLRRMPNGTYGGVRRQQVK
jgi:hypothetical protein